MNLLTRKIKESSGYLSEQGSQEKLNNEMNKCISITSVNGNITLHKKNDLSHILDNETQTDHVLQPQYHSLKPSELPAL